MKKVYHLLMLSTFFVLGIQFKAMSQVAKKSNAYYDALMLADIHDNYADLETDAVKKFLNAPFTDSLSKSELKEIREKYLEKMNSLGLTAQGILGANLSISSSYQSLVIDAVSKLVAEEFKDGVTNMYINTFKAKLDTIKLLKALLPKTSDFLQKSDPFNYASLGNEFKGYFEDDLKGSVDNLTGFLATTNVAPYSSFRNNTTVYPTLVFSADIGNKMVNGYHPEQLIEYLEAKYRSQPGFADHYKVIKVINDLQLNIQDLDRKPAIAGLDGKVTYQNVWLSLNKLLLLNTPLKIEYFFALINVQDPTFLKNLGISTSNAADKDIFFREKMIPLISKIHQMDNLLSKTQITPDDYNQLAQLTLDLIKGINVLITVPKISPDVFIVSQKIIDIHRSILSKDYAAVFSNILFVVEKLSPPDASSDEQIINFRNAVLRYGPFVTGVVTAKNADDLKETLKKAILPASNYLVKRNSVFSLTLTAHPGVVVGYERIKNGDVNGASTYDWKPNLGLTVPIGFEFAWGTTSEFKPGDKGKKLYMNGKKVRKLDGAYWGFMLSFADIGAVVNYRLNSPSNELPDKVTFRQVFAPGLSLQHGFKNTPLTLGIGAQYTPELRKLTNDGASTDVSSLRAQLRLTWDLPLVNISTR